MSLFRKGKAEDKDGCGVYATDDENATTTEEIPLPQFQSTDHAGYYGYNSPLLHSRTSVVQEYLAHCIRYRAHSKNAKYVVCEMMNSRRAPTNRVSYLNMRYEGGQTIASVCKCRNLDDLIKVWDVKYTLPLHKNTTLRNAETTAGMDLHNYDDRYFLDHDRFLRERGKDDVVNATATSDIASSGECDEKKLEDSGDDSQPLMKRPKL